MTPRRSLHPFHEDLAVAWIAACKGLSRKREVVGASASTGRSRHEVVGLLIDFWDWVDGETSDGTIPGVTLEQLPSIIGADVNFWLAICAVGWLKVIPGQGLEIPNFDRWLGQSAKKRLQKTRRQERWRDASVDVDASTKAPTREEKRREENRGAPEPAEPPRSDEVPIAPRPPSEFNGSAEDLAQRFADAYRGTYRGHKNPDDTRDGFAELLRLGVNPNVILAAINDPKRDRTEFFNDFKRRITGPPGKARAAPVQAETEEQRRARILAARAEDARQRQLIREHNQKKLAESAGGKS